MAIIPKHAGDVVQKALRFPYRGEYPDEENGYKPGDIVSVINACDYDTERGIYNGNLGIVLGRHEIIDMSYNVKFIHKDGPFPMFHDQLVKVGKMDE
jgi:hypothetical protein